MYIQKFQLSNLAQDSAIVGGSVVGSYAVLMNYIDGFLAIGLTLSGITYTVVRTYILWKEHKKKINDLKSK